jgi:predicted Na+-dependent transporter
VLRKGLTRTPDLLLPLALATAALALLLPWQALAERSDWALAALVAFTALGIPPAELAALRERKLALAALVVAPLALLPPLAWAVSQLFAEPVLAGGTDVAVGELVGRFALVVLVPLAAGLGARALAPRLQRAERELAGLAAISLLVLVYQAMSGASAGGQLWSAALASALFLIGCAAPAAAWIALTPATLRLTGALAIAVRDFAVAAVLAAQAFGPPAATVAGVYGVLMLLAGVVAAQLLPTQPGPRRKSPHEGATPGPDAHP